MIVDSEAVKDLWQIEKDSTQVTIAQSGSIARYAAKLAGCYPTDPLQAAFSDQIFEMAQELCTINPLINCMTGARYNQVKDWYFDQFPEHLDNLSRQLEMVKGDFFGGEKPSFADFNVFHMFNNALMADSTCLGHPAFENLRQWMDRMQNLPGLKEYLQNRPDLIGIGTEPSLVDSNGVKCNQREGPGRCMIENDLFVYPK